MYLLYIDVLYISLYLNKILFTLIEEEVMAIPSHLISWAECCLINI